MMGGRTVKGTPFVFWLILAGFEANSTISENTRISPYRTKNSKCGRNALFTNEIQIKGIVVVVLDCIQYMSTSNENPQW